MRSITLTPEALNDIESIKEHIATEFGNDNANKITKAIFKDIKRLSKYPNTDNKLFIGIFSGVCEIGYF